MLQLLAVAETTAIVTTSDAWIKLASVPYDKIEYNDVDAKDALKARLKRHPWLDPARTLSDAERRTVSHRLWACSDMAGACVQRESPAHMTTVCRRCAGVGSLLPGG
jgi:hypothetical protein